MLNRAAAELSVRFAEARPFAVIGTDTCHATLWLNEAQVFYPLPVYLEEGCKSGIQHHPSLPARQHQQYRLRSRQRMHPGVRQGPALRQHGHVPGFGACGTIAGPVHRLKPGNPPTVAVRRQRTAV